MKINVLQSRLYLRKDELKLNYKIETDDNYLTLGFENEYFSVFIAIRLQFGDTLKWTNFSYLLKNNIHKNLKKVIPNNLYNYYEKDDLVLVVNDFYKNDYSFSQEIEGEEELNLYLSEFCKCVRFYETEIFPKLTDINFLAEYVGSVPFEQRSEIVVGGSFPLQLFKKLSILKWGNHSRYEEYKEGTQKLIELYRIKKTEKADEVKLFQQGFEKLIYHLENEPNPFL